jgi:bla regulator protein blaR1
VARIFGPAVAYGLWLLPAARVLMPSLERKVPAVSEGQTAAAVSSNASELLFSAMPGEALSPVAASAPSVDWIQIAISLWLGIAALIFVVQMLRYVSMRETMLADANSLGKIGKVRLIESDQVSGPLAFGLFKRYIAVPMNFNTIFPPAEREMALAHEMAHHRSGDLFANLAAFILLCLSWFNPLSWLAWRAFRFDQEAACDARVLQGRDGEAKLIYGRALARAAHDGLPTFATALNSPATIIARLRNLTMKDVSKPRRLFGKAGILAAIGVIVPLTATTVPVWAHDESKDKAETSGARPVTRGTFIDVSGDNKTPYVVTIKRDGRTVVLRTDKKLSDTEIDKLVDEAEVSRIDADRAAAEADNASAAADSATADADSKSDDAWSAEEDARKDRKKRIIIRANRRTDAITSARTDSDGEHSHAHAVSKNHVAWSDSGDYISNMIPEIKISEITDNCAEGQPVTTDVRGFDGKNRSSVRLVMCGKGMAKQAKLAALEGLRDACDEVKSDDDMPKDVRRKVVKQLEAQIRRLEREQKSES